MQAELRTSSTRRSAARALPLSLAALLALTSLPLAVPAAEAAPQPFAVGVATGAVHTCVLLSDGNADCYGRGGAGQAVDYTLGDAVAVTAGLDHTCFLVAGGNVRCRGGEAYDFGQAQGREWGDAVAVDAGWVHTCILVTFGNAVCQGYSGDGQGGNYSGGDAVAVSAGTQHSCVLTGAGDVDCWGTGSWNVSDDYRGGDAVAVSAGHQHTCALLESGDVRCWGYNGYGEADGYFGGDAVAVAAGSYFTCVLTAAGEVTCFGEGSDGRTLGHRGGNATAIAAGQGHACALLASGTVDCWGSNSYGEAEDWPPAPTPPPPEPVPSLPRNLTAQAGPAAGQISLAWLRPASDGGLAITGYAVYRGGADGGEALLATVHGETSFTDSGLGDGTTWRYRVAAVNDAGEGPSAYTGNRTTFRAPSAPRDLAATTGVLKTTLTWQAPAHTGGTPVLAYDIYRGDRDGPGEHLTTVGGNVLSYTDTGCPVATQCVYRVGAVNLVGPGRLSDKAHALGTGLPV